MNTEQIFLACCISDASFADKALQRGLKRDSFDSPENGLLWHAILALRAKGDVVDTNTISMELGVNCPMAELLACDPVDVVTSAVGDKALQQLIEAAASRSIGPKLQRALALLGDEKPIEDVKDAVQQARDACDIDAPEEHNTGTIVDECVQWLDEELSNTHDKRTMVTTGIQTLDAVITPIQSHEFVVVGARTSHGKSSFMVQMAGHNLGRGLTVAYFTMETSARAVVLQMCAQRADVNLRKIKEEFPDKVEAYREQIKKTKDVDLHVFENDLSLGQVEARCRILAASIKPDVVFIDYLGLMRISGESQYQKMTALSKAMIPLKKACGCALIVAAQLNRGNEQENRAPKRTDFRDSGSIEEDAHRILALHRPEKDRNGIAQTLDNKTFDMEVLQLKMRDGPLAQAAVFFHAPTTKFSQQ